jgi:hypothetical protein
MLKLLVILNTMLRHNRKWDGRFYSFTWQEHSCFVGERVFVPFILPYTAMSREHPEARAPYPKTYPINSAAHNPYHEYAEAYICESKSYPKSGDAVPIPIAGFCTANPVSIRALESIPQATTIFSAIHVVVPSMALLKQGFC